MLKIDILPHLHSYAITIVEWHLLKIIFWKIPFYFKRNESIIKKIQICKLNYVAENRGLFSSSIISQLDHSSNATCWQRKVWMKKAMFEVWSMTVDKSKKIIENSTAKELYKANIYSIFLFER